MSRLGDSTFLNSLVTALNENDKFELQTQWFDGSILLEEGTSVGWLKVYRGKVIDHLPLMPPLGYTFKLTAPYFAWNELVDGAPFTTLLLGGKRKFTHVDDVVDDVGQTPGDFKLEGNLMEAHRMIEAVYLIADTYRSAAGGRTERTVVA